MEILIYIATAFIFIALITATYASISGAPWVPTKKSNIERFLKLAKIKKGEKVYDLGCGDGRIVFAGAKKGAFVTGLELAFLFFLFAKVGRFFQKEKENIEIKYKSIWKADLRDADVVYFFLMPRIYPKLQEKLERELKKGTRVVAFVWPMKGWEPVIVDKEDREPDLYLYKM
jgi:SAM-dependent methyltransferase